MMEVGNLHFCGEFDIQVAHNLLVCVEVCLSDLFIISYSNIS